ncbi:MAG: GNAT family N-acetyltransferase [Polyangiales bacterium]
MKPSTRPTATADAVFLRELHDSVRRRDFAGLPEPLVRMLLDQQYSAFEAACRACPGLSDLVVELDGRPVGRVVVSETEPQIVILDLSLIEDARGLGIGSSLIEGLSEVASRRGVPIRLHTDTGHRARRLYERLGFVVEEVREPTVQYVRHPRKRGELV